MTLDTNAPRLLSDSPVSMFTKVHFCIMKCHKDIEISFHCIALHCSCNALQCNATTVPLLKSCHRRRSLFLITGGHHILNEFSFAPRLTIIFTTSSAAGERRPTEGMTNFCVKIINGHNGDDEEEIYFLK